MIVEIVGGPKDGETLEVPDNTDAIEFPIQRTHKFNEDSDELPQDDMEVAIFDIVPLHGRFYIYWKEL